VFKNAIQNIGEVFVFLKRAIMKLIHLHKYIFPLFLIATWCHNSNSTLKHFDGTPIVEEIIFNI
ncbi:hypothetical protein, partial [Allobacillus saliphilus]